MDAGTWADWVVAAFTGAGFAGAIVQLRANLKDSQTAREDARNEETARREAMARAVGVKASWQPNPRGGPPDGHEGLMPVDVEVLNSGPYLIDGAVLQLASDGVPMEIVYGTILPGEHLKDTHEVHRTEVVFGELTGGVTLLFTDTYGDHWARTPQGLERRDQAARIC